MNRTPTTPKALLCFIAAAALTTIALAGPAAALDGRISVMDHGAAGDGVADDTAAVQAALDAAGADGGGGVFLPKGRYRIEGNLVIPRQVTLEGTWRAPVQGEPFGEDGAVLLALGGKGDADGAPFIRMGTNSVLKGLSIFYPEQIRANPPLPYPWTVQANGPADNIAILDVTMVNPYQAVDLGTWPAGRHLVRNLYAYPLFKGLYVNQCYDVGRLENIHFWPFWDLDPASPLWEFTKNHATAFIIGKTDGEMAYGLFSIFYKVSMHFIAGPVYDADRNVATYAPGSGTYTNCYLDVSPTAVLVDAAMDHAGVSFVNSSFMSKVVVGPKNRGTVKFTGCGFWAEPALAEHAVLEGYGPVQFSACHFSNWDRAGAGVPCIDANNRRLIVTGSDFMTARPESPVIALGPRVRSAVITSNTMPGGVRIINNAPARSNIVIEHNVAEPEPNFITSWLVLGPFPNPPLDTLGEAAAETDADGHVARGLAPRHNENGSVGHGMSSSSRGGRQAGVANSLDPTGSEDSPDARGESDGDGYVESPSSRGGRQADVANSLDPTGSEDSPEARGESDGDGYVESPSSRGGRQADVAISFGPTENPTVPGNVTRAGYHRDFLEPLGGETNAILAPGMKLDHGSGSLEVRPLDADERHFLDFYMLYAEPFHVAYAQAYVFSERPQRAYFDFGMNDGGKVWVNGALAYARFTPVGQPCEPGSDLFRADLASGWNRLLVKVEDGGGRRWEFVAEAYGEDGEPLRTAVEP